MATYALVQERIYEGYGKAARHLGKSFDHYRPTSAIDPISPPFLIGSILMSTTPAWSYMKYDGYGSSDRILLVNGNVTQKNDYFVNADETFYVAAMQPLLPIMGVQVDSVINVTRASQPADEGKVGYVGHTDATDITLMQNVPASILKGSRGANNPVDLPTDTKMPAWQIFIPFLGDVILLNGDFIIDEHGVRYVISAHELTDLGWRIEAIEVGA